MIRIVTAADHQYFTRLIAMIGSVIRNHKAGEFSISVYDIGLSEEQREVVSRISGVEVCEIEKVNDLILTPIKSHVYGDNKMVPGLYTWKPVATKMELDADWNGDYSFMKKHLSNDNSNPGILA